MSGTGREALQLRFHFGERDRAGDAPLDVAVMDACARHGVWAAALLRGVEGFGAKHLERTDRLLSMSEDAPLVAVAVGEREGIERLAAEARAIAAGGLLTIEGVEAVAGGVVAQGRGVGGDATQGSAVGGDVVEGDGDEGGAVQGVGVGDVGVAGLATTGTPTTTAAGVGVPVVGSLEDGVGDVVRATIWGPRTGNRSPHLRVVDALYRHGAESATVLLGVDGVLDGERRRARFVASNRGVPAITVAIGERGAIVAALAEVEGLANLVTLDGSGAVEQNRRQATERLHGEGGVEPKWRIEPPTLHGEEGVEGNSVIDRGKLHADAGVERSSRIAGGKLHGGGEAAGARVAVLTSEGARGDGGPRYLALIHALRRGGAPGATALRGVWGFCGEVAPHGDRVLALRRDVPVIVETVDSVERAGEWLGVAESLAGEADVVYSQEGLRILTLD